MGKLEGKVAIVTGAGCGIGLEIARSIAKQGARLLLNDRDGALAREAALSIDPSGELCVACAGDASDPVFIEEMVKLAVQRFGGLHVAVANAGLTIFNRFLEVEVAELRKMLDLNLQGSVFLAKFAALEMVKQGEGGRLVFISSVTGHQAHEGVVCYGMTKAALRMLAKGLVAELAPHGITSNAVSPGATVTERTAAGDPMFAEKWAKTTPTGRAAFPSDIANAVLFLISPESSQITGQTIVVDGGWTSTSEVPDFEH
ncbi:SDR family NAD(P)-dependent oxidoreductase [Pelagicoccus enzymogenes]|uniref:SDR family NAD(P)-dependent oxidoreductase n=1 Tax=Pelagicoccus enzymogenes TaxID=2773457 RepID=UPI00280D8250|nr:SDR family oxidoreductase [Pelagicoccus enzymogenes]MDQ8197680.1 SDR family NAD(P)-dependent oxidoreductase [Pelagicoccus enzymogenes]